MNSSFATLEVETTSCTSIVIPENLERQSSDGRCNRRTRAEQRKAREGPLQTHDKTTPTGWRDAAVFFRQLAVPHLQRDPFIQSRHLSSQGHQAYTFSIFPGSHTSCTLAAHRDVYYSKKSFIPVSSLDSVPPSLSHHDCPRRPPHSLFILVLLLRQ